MAHNSVILPPEEHLAFHCSIGVAIAQWAFVENSLCHVAGACLSLGHAIAPGFYAIENFRSKLAFVHRSFQNSRFAATYWDEWNTLQLHIQGLATKRNAIAHGRSAIFSDAPAGRRYALCPIVWETPKKKSAKGLPPAGALCLRDLDLYAKQFSKASVRLTSLWSRMSGDEDMFAEAAQQEPQPQSLAQLRHQIYAMSPRRAKSSREKS